jgi:hypothetical protein
MSGGITLRLRRLSVFAAGALLAFSPWLIRNAAFTGNPVYPFAYRLLGGAAWSPAQDAQWARGHALPEEQRTVTGRLHAVRTELFGLTWDQLSGRRPPMFGVTLFLFAAAGLAVARNRAVTLLTVWCGLMIAVWAVATHMPGRFLVPVVVPLSLMAGRTLSGVPAGGWRRRFVVTLTLAVATVMAAADGFVSMRLLTRDARHWQQYGVRLRDWVGQTEAVQELDYLNRIVPEHATVWLLGEARVFYAKPDVRYTVVFSRDPWLEAAETVTPAEAVAWLRTQNVTHVVFSWDEIERLQRTYGYPAFVTPDWAARVAGGGLQPVVLEPEEGITGVAVYAVAPR